MEQITHNKTKGVFFPQAEYDRLSKLVILQREEISELKKEVGL